MSEELDLSIDNYISDEFSICREERQYALYLSNVLRYYGKNPKNPNKKDADDNSKPCNRIDNEKIKNIFLNLLPDLRKRKTEMLRAQD